VVYAAVGCHAVNKLAGADVRRVLNFLFFKARFKLCLFARIGDNRPWVFAFIAFTSLECNSVLPQLCQHKFRRAFAARFEANKLHWGG